MRQDSRWSLVGLIGGIGAVVLLDTRRVHGNVATKEATEARALRTTPERPVTVPLLLSASQVVASGGELLILIGGQIDRHRLYIGIRRASPNRLMYIA